MVAMCVCYAAAGAFFFGKNDVPGICMPCVCVCYAAAGAFFSEKMTFLGFLRHVIALLRSSYVPQALFSGKQ